MSELIRPERGIAQSANTFFHQYETDPTYHLGLCKLLWCSSSQTRREVRKIDLILHGLSIHAVPYP